MWFCRIVPAPSRVPGLESGWSGHRQPQRGIRSAEALTQRATFGAAQVASQRRPCEFMLHEVVPITPPTPWLLVLLVVVETLVS